MFSFDTPHWVDALPSTNTALVAHLRGDPQAWPAGTVLAARQQTAGRGRLERSWLSAPGRDLTFSFVVDVDAAVDRASPGSLPLATALGVVDWLDSLGLVAGIKWPNDVRTARGKICGILAEQAARGCVVVGVGLNITAGAAAGLDRAATSVAAECGCELAPEEALRRLLPHVEPRLRVWLQGGFAALRDACRDRAVWVGDEICVDGAAGSCTGILEGFGPEGELLLRGADGRLLPVWSGDVERVRRARDDRQFNG